MASNTSDLNNSAGVVNQGGTLNARDIYVNAEALSQENFALPPLIKTFTGRDKEMRRLDSLFFNKDEEIKGNKVVICGFGGIGKSELAKQFAKKCQDAGKVQKTFWVNAESESELRRVKIVYNSINKEKCIFILDNGISVKMLAECGLEFRDDGFYIITSQQKQWGRDIISVQLDSLELKFALDFYKTNLKADYKDEDQKLYIKLSEFVGCIPQGLQITAAHVYEAKEMYGENYLEIYVRKLEKTQSEIIEKDFPSSSDNSYKYSIYTAITVSLNKLPNSYLASYVVYVCSYLNPERIYLDNLLKVLNNIDKLLKKAKNLDEDKLNEALFMIKNVSLVSYNPNVRVIRMHRFVQEVLRYHLRYHDTVMQNHCFAACLKCFLSDVSIYYSVLQHVDENITVFNHFYNKLNEQIVKYSPHYNKVFTKLCDALIAFECIKSLDIMLAHLGNRVQEYIAEFRLFNIAACSCNETNILELFLKYVDVNIKDIIYENTPLHSATSRFNFKAIEFLLDEKADINIRNEKGNTPLFEFFKGVPSTKCIDLNEVETVFQLFEFKICKTFTNNKGETYLHVVRNGDLAKYLITKYQVDVNSQDSKQRTPLHTLLYARRWYGDVIKVLLLHGALLNIVDSNGLTPIAVAQQNQLDTKLILLFFNDRDIEHLRKLFKEFGDRNVIKIVNESKLLHRTIKDNQTDILDLLLQYEIDIDTKLILTFSEDRYIEQLRKVFKKFGGLNVIKIVNESKLLHRVIKDNQTYVLNLLLEYDINININGDEWQTPLHTAISTWNLNSIKILITRGANLHEEDFVEKILLHILFYSARFQEHINLDEVNEILELLQCKCSECNYNINEVNDYQHILLHVAAMSCHVDLVDILAGKYKLNVNALDFDGDTPLHNLIVVQLKQTKLLQFLEVIYFSHKRYRDRLHSRKECDVIETVQKLKEYGAKLDIENNKGLTPFKLAELLEVKFLLPYLKF